MIRVESLTKRYGSLVAVQDLSLEVAAGELFALLGPNGAGKSTTLACLLGFERPDAGRAVIDGLDVAEHPDRARQRVAYIPELVSLYEQFSGLENVALFAALAGHHLSSRALADLLTRAGLQREAHNRRASTYSKGMRQKVGIAIALAKRARALLLDEPTSGLDPGASHEFASALAALREEGVAVLMATHDLFRTLHDATCIGILKHGRLVASHRGGALSHAELERLYLDAMTTA